MTYKIAFFDVDGTILNTKAEIPASTKAAIEKLQNNGIIVVIATGRPIYEAQDLLKELGVQNIVAMNGGQALINGKYIINEKLSNELVHKTIEKSNQVGASLTLLGSNNAHHTDTNHKVLQEFNQRFGFQKIREKNNPLETIGDVQLMTIYCTNEEAKTNFDFIEKEAKMIKWFGMLESGCYIDIYPSGQNKSIGLKLVLDELNINPKEAIAFGDGMNDLEMIEFVGLGVAMGNAHKELKEKAKLVTDHVDEDGIEKALMKIGLI